MPTRPTTLSEHPRNRLEQRPGALTRTSNDARESGTSSARLRFQPLQLTHMAAVQELSDGRGCSRSIKPE